MTTALPDTASGHDMATAATGGLRIVRELTSGLGAAGIHYCHWKGNARLPEAVAGLRDLDVLVNRDQAGALGELLAAHGFKRFDSSPWEAVPAIEDWLAFDPDTGRLVHLHLHYRLTVGESYLNGYRLPWEAEVLATRRYEARHGLYVAEPAMELLLLIARGTLRLGPIDRILALVGRSGFGAQARADLHWLAARTDQRRLAELSQRLLGPDATGLLLSIVKGKPTGRRLAALRRRATPPLSAYRTYFMPQALFRQWMRVSVGVVIAVNRRLLRSIVFPGHTLANGGALIAFAGDDRPRRSALVRRIAAWLTWKLDVVVARSGPAARRKAFRARSRGLIVLYDGEPHPDTPDLVITLRSGSAVGRATPDRVDIDAGQPDDQVLLQAQRAVWSRL